MTEQPIRSGARGLVCASLAISVGVAACDGQTSGSAGDGGTRSSNDGSTGLPFADSSTLESGPPSMGGDDSGPGGPPVSDSFVLATLGPTLDQNGNNLCTFAATAAELAIGTPTGGLPVTAVDGSSQSGGVVGVSCSVVTGFDVTLQAGLSGPTGSTLVISGQVSVATGGMNVRGSLTSSGDAFVENDCTIAFTYRGGRVPAAPPIAPGRIWGHLSCPNMVNPSVAKRLMDGTQVSETCDGEADFLFENCAQ